MIIQDNVIKHYLRNVYFICGNACGGKTTMSRMLAEKHGFLLYDMDAVYSEHRAIALPEYQPDTCYHMKDYHEQWTRSAEEQARWNMSSLAEQTDMTIMDLIALSQNRKVVADVLFSPAYTSRTVDYGHFVFLAVNRSEIRRSYFNRPEKRGFYEFVKSKPMADVYFENIFAGLELTNDREQALMRESGLFMLERTREMTRERMLEQIERHFGLR
jgi:hypothetical protein